MSREPAAHSPTLTASRRSLAKRKNVTTTVVGARGQSSAIRTARWLAILPGALIAGWAAWAAINLVNRLTFSWQGLNPDWFVSRVYIEGMSHGALGAAGVYAGAKIAPARKAATVFVLAVLFVLGAGFLLFPAIIAANWWAMYGAVALAVGAGSVCWSVYSGETTFS